MKLIKNTILAAVALMGVAFTACSDDDNYVPGAQGAGVYLPAIAGSQLELALDQTTFNVPVARIGETSAATYAVTAEYDESMFSVPTSVSFAEGQTETNIVVTYDPATVGQGKTREISISLESDGVQVYPYGAISETFNVIIPVDWTSWEPFMDGTGSYIYNPEMVYSGVDEGLAIDVRYNKNNENHRQYRISGWASKSTMTIDYENGVCRIDPQYTGEDYQEGAPIMVCDYANYMIMQGGSADKYLEASFFDEEIATFELLLVYYVPGLGAFGAGYEEFAVDGLTDYTVSVKFSGIFTNADGETSAVVNTVVGADASNTLVAVASADEYSVDEVIDGVFDGSIQTVSAPAGSSEVKVPFTGSGTFHAVAITFNGEEPMEYDACTFVYGGGNGGSSWVDFGQAGMIDGWITAIYSYNSADGSRLTYEDLGWFFPVQKSATTPGLYRLISPWTNENAVCTILGFNENSEPANILLDLTNPDCPKIAPQYSGFELKDAQVTGSTKAVPFYIANQAGYLSTLGATDEELIAEGYADVLVEGCEVQIADPVFDFSAAFENVYSWTGGTRSYIYLENLDNGAQSPAKRIRVAGKVNELNLNFERNNRFAKVETRKPGHTPKAQLGDIDLRVNLSKYRK